MGYMSTIEGELMVVRRSEPITASPQFRAEAQKLGIEIPEPLLTGVQGMSPQLMRRINDKDSTEIRYWISEITDQEIIFDGEGKAYSFSDDLKNLVNDISKDGCVVNGSITRNGEDHDDRNLYRVENNKIHTITGHWVWDD